MKPEQKHLRRSPVWRYVGNWLLIITLSFLLVKSCQLDNSTFSNTAPTTKDAAHTDPAHVKKPSLGSITGSTASPDSNRRASQISPGDWPGYMLDNSSFNQDETRINPATAGQLRIYWKYHAQGSITTQPVVVDNTIYWGSWDGFEHATTLDGKQVWSTNIGATSDNDPDCDPSSVGVASTATIAPIAINGQMLLVDFVGGGDANFYALNAANGHIIWKTSLENTFGNFIWSSPTLYKGSIYFGIASFGDCPSVQGELVQLDSITGAIQNVFKAVPDSCAGASLWSSPVIDKSTGELYISTGNFSACAAYEDYAEALIELHASNLAVVGSWQVPSSEQVLDGDFGSTPTLFTATINGVSNPMVGTINKNGIYYAFVRGAINNGPVWRAQISYLPPCPTCEGPGNVSPAAWDGATLYIAGSNTTINGAQCQGSIRALDPTTGKYIWEHCFTDARAMAAIALVKGVVVVGEGPFMNVLDTSSGDMLFVYQDTNNGSIFYGPPSISHGLLFIGNYNGNLFAFKFGSLSIHDPG